MNVTAINLPSVVSVSLLVIAGKYGTGEERKKKLERDGYSYSTVQNCVNELLPILNKYA